jgi:hypothetical protein
MHKSFHAIVLTASVLCLAGCEGRSSHNDASKPKPEAWAAKSDLPPAPIPFKPSVPSLPLAPSVDAMPEPPPPASSAQPSVALSMGVALAQTTTEGTMMMFSVDYEVQGDSGESEFLWVIARAKGDPVKIRVKMSGKSNLMIPMAKWRTEDGPFKSHIEDLKGKRLSDSIEMK